MGSYWERVTTLVCDIVETCSVLVKLYLICFEKEIKRDILLFCRKCPQWTILYHVKLKLFTTVIAIENIQVNKSAVFSKQIR
jgi:hypothetical protein